METFETGAVRDTGGKGRMDLIPWCAVRRISKHMEDALTHYPERNWENGLPMHSMIDSAFRHLAKYMDGWTDEDHLCAACTNLLMAMWTEENKPDMQDIPTRFEVVDNKNGTYTKRPISSPTQPDMPSLPLNTTSVVLPTQPKKSQGKAKETHSMPCSCYDATRKECIGTKERDQCQCEGNRLICDFYPTVRKEARESVKEK